jgi:hypothetical protein
MILEDINIVIIIGASAPVICGCHSSSLIYSIIVITLRVGFLGVTMLMKYQLTGARVKQGVASAASFFLIPVTGRIIK